MDDDGALDFWNRMPLEKGGRCHASDVNIAQLQMTVLQKGETSAQLQNEISRI